jgi:glycosyltransferase involved in cell wall biosynthesis
MAASYQPQFTIAIPVYNGGPFIAATLDSLLAQTYPHFDIVVLENASTDQTKAIVQGYTDPRIRMISSNRLLPIEENWARIQQIENHNEFLVLMCADDILRPRFLEAIAQLILAEPSASLYHTWATFIDDTGAAIGQCPIVAARESADELLNAIHELRQAVFGTGYVMRFADFKRVGGYPPYTKLLFSDIFCYYELTKLSYKACVQESLVGFRRHPDSTGINAQISEFISASLTYRQDLEHAGYLNNLQHQKLLEQFLYSFFLTYWRNNINDFIKAGSDRNSEAFYGTISTLSATDKARKLQPYDAPLWVYIKLAEIPYRTIRLPLFYLLLLWVKAWAFLYPKIR